jgi:predicted Zn-dependent protease
MANPGDRIFRREVTRRDFLWLVSVGGSAAAAPVLLAGCATDPVTGRSTLSGLSEQDEIRIDRQQAPYQFSTDYGVAQDAALNRYVNDVGAGLWTRSHRPKMPYSARVVNANYINAYTFPAGSIGVSRGIMLDIQSEDELAGLLGHEIGHVNARHAAERAGRVMIAQGGAVIAQIGLAVVGLGELGQVAGQVTQVGASALLASYSRDDEREADALGLEYMTRAGYNADGMVGLMDLLNKEGREQPSMIQTMFSSHPMSAERYETARREATTKYAASRTAQVKRERYLDSTASLRALAPAIKAEQRGETLAAQGKVAEATQQFAQALQLAPNDYPGLLLMTKAQLAQKRYAEAEPYVDRAVAVYPNEGQALKLSGIVKIALRKPELAYQRFDAYDRALPGDPSALFFKGISLEAMQNRNGAAQHYAQYLRAGGSGRPAQYARQRLQQWSTAK